MICFRIQSLGDGAAVVLKYERTNRPRSSTENPFNKSAAALLEDFFPLAKKGIELNRAD